MPVDIPDILSRCPFFTQLDATGRSRLAAIAVTRSYEKGQLIFQQDVEPPGMFIVVDGLVRVYKLAPSGKEHVLHLASPGQTFAEVAAIADFPTPAFAEAVETTVCVMLPARALRQLLRDDHELCLQVLASMSFWVRHLVGLLEDIVLRDAVGRLARYLLDAPCDAQGVLRLPGLKKHLASHLNLTSETLSRTLRRLAEAGAIESAQDGAVKVIDGDALESAAEGAFPHY